MTPDAGGSSADPATTEPATERERLFRLFHDMRAPLTVIIGWSELLVNDEVDPLSPKQRDFLGDILEAGQQLVKLVEDFTSDAQKRTETDETGCP